MFKKSNRGQSTAEYAVVIGLVIAAAVAMQVYVKRGIQGKIRSATDFTINEGGINIGNDQYEPYYLSQSLETTRTGSTTTELRDAGMTIRSICGDTGGEVTSRTGTVTTLNTEGGS